MYQPKNRGMFHKIVHNVSQCIDFVYTFLCCSVTSMFETVIPTCVMMYVCIQHYLQHYYKQLVPTLVKLADFAIDMRIAAECKYINFLIFTTQVKMMLFSPCQIVHAKYELNLHGAKYQYNVTQAVQQYYATDAILSVASLDRWLCKFHPSYIQALQNCTNEEPKSTVTIIFAKTPGSMIMYTSQIDLQNDRENFTGKSIFDGDVNYKNLPAKLLVPEPDKLN